jgi:two-component system cell cycle response regulator DivK
LRAHRRFKDALIVAVTADVSMENMEQARRAGFDGFIGKPIDPDRFPNQIRDILQGEEVWELE